MGGRKGSELVVWTHRSIFLEDEEDSRDGRVLHQGWARAAGVKGLLG